MINGQKINRRLTTLTFIFVSLLVVYIIYWYSQKKELWVLSVLAKGYLIIVIGLIVLIVVLLFVISLLLFLFFIYTKWGSKKE